MVERYKPKTPITGKFGIPKGGKRTNPNAGRHKGSKNVYTVALKTAILAAADKLGDLREVKYRDPETGKVRTKRVNGPDGVTGYCMFLGRTLPEVFARLLEKSIPLQMTGEGGGPLKVESLSRIELVAELNSRGIPVNRIFDDAVPMKTIEHRDDEKVGD